MIRDDAIKIWKAGVAAVHGRTLVENSVRLDGNQLTVADQSFDLAQFDRILVVGGGKFSHYMAAGIEAVLGSELSRKKNLSGLITVPDGSNEQVQLQFVEAAECRPKGINLPTQRVIDATNRMVEQLREVDERTLALALISGGGSALIEKSTLPLDDIISATNWLSSRGANIIELNSVRIAASEVKGGGLASAMPSGTMVGLIVSDVPGDDLRFVSSGPTVDFGNGVVGQAQQVLDRFDAKADPSFPESVSNHLNSTIEFPKLRATVSNFLLGNADVAERAAIETAKSLGYEVLDDLLAKTETCDQIADVVLSWCTKPADGKQCIVSLGEPVVQPGKSAGQGGRNQHAVLCAIKKLLTAKLDSQFCFLSAGTDGEDGTTSVAGAHVTHYDIETLAGQTASISKSLTQFNSHPILSANGLVFETGPTATNVADLRVLLRNANHAVFHGFFSQV